MEEILRETWRKATMDLDYYLWKNKIFVKDFAKNISVAESTLCQIVKGRVSPRLLTAIKIMQETRGEVTFIELLGKKDRKEILKRFDAQEKTKETQTAGKI